MNKRKTNSHAKAVIKNFAEQATRRDASLLHPGFAYGSAGVSQFLFEVAKFEKDPSLKIAADRFLHHSFETLRALPLDICNLKGWVSFLWVARLQDRKVTPEIVARINEGLITKLPQLDRYDASDGLCGYGHFLLRGKPHRGDKDKLSMKTLSSIIERIDELMTPVPANLGFAHGIAGALAFLSYCLIEKRATPRTARVVAKLAEVLATSALSQTTTPHRLGSGEERDRWRVSWCYGDTGVALALLRASQALKRDDLAAAARLVLLRNFARSDEEMEITHEYLCHGTGGNALIAHRMFQATREPMIARLRDKWLESTLDRLTDEPLLEPWTRNSEGNGLITSKLGAAASVLECLRFAPSGFDQILLIS